jgi:tRNA(fMet)-specific endonuclease VapC
VKQGLTWLNVEPFTDEVAEEAAEIQHELRKAGQVLSKADNLIAGQVREAGATLVTRDDDFERVEDMDVTVLNQNRDEDGS